MRRPRALALYELAQAALFIAFVHSTGARLEVQNAAFPYCGTIGWETGPIPQSLVWWYVPVGFAAFSHLSIGVGAWARAPWARRASLAACALQVGIGGVLAYRSIGCCAFSGLPDGRWLVAALLLALVAGILAVLDRPDNGSIAPPSRSTIVRMTVGLGVSAGGYLGFLSLALDARSPEATVRIALEAEARGEWPTWSELWWERGRARVQEWQGRPELSPSAREFGLFWSAQDGDSVVVQVRTEGYIPWTYGPPNPKHGEARNFRLIRERDGWRIVGIGFHVRTGPSTVHEFTIPGEFERAERNVTDDKTGQFTFAVADGHLDYAPVPWD
ncbi:MAG: hypothetical protein HY720_15155 [Planctomycetes bacterium]|nr:hypothetical protein [Planctomycetota bacterium]